MLIVLVLNLIAAAMVLEFECGNPANIDSYPDALWWAVTTITTVGYGDRFPIRRVGSASLWAWTDGRMALEFPTGRARGVEAETKVRHHRHHNADHRGQAVLEPERSGPEKGDHAGQDGVDDPTTAGVVTYPNMVGPLFQPAVAKIPRSSSWWLVTKYRSSSGANSR